MLRWLHSLLPHIPHYGFVLVFIVVFLNDIGVPMPGKTILIGVGVFLGKAEGSLWQPMAAGTAAGFLGGSCAFWLGRRLGHGGLGKIRWLHLTDKKLAWPERFFKRHGAKAVLIARFIPLFPPFAANLLAGMTKMSWRTFLFYNITGWRSGSQLHPDRIFVCAEVESSRSLVGSNGALPDSGGDSPHLSGCDFQTFRIQVFGARFFQKT